MKYLTALASTPALACLSLLLIDSCSAGDAKAGDSQLPLFAPAMPIAVVGEPSDIVLGDMNGDGKPDLVVACEQPRGIGVLLGQGNGQFRSMQGPPTSVNESAGELVLGDVNSDGNLDLAFVNHDSYAVTMLLGDGKGGLALAPSSTILMKEGQHPHTHGLAMADLNGDQKLDFVTVNNADNDLSISLGDGRGGFHPAPGSPYAVGPSPYPLALGDVNHDGSLDIVATATATGPQRKQQLPLSHALTLLLADGHGGFRTSQLPLRTGEPWFAAIGDVNGDGHADILATHHEIKELTVLLGDGRGGFAETSASPLDFGRAAFQIALADVNRDGKLDVLGASGDGVRVLLGDGAGGFEAAPHSPFLTGSGTWGFAIGDVNADTKLDLVTSNAEKNPVTVLLGQ